MESCTGRGNALLAMRISHLFVCVVCAVCGIRWSRVPSTLVPARGQDDHLWRRIPMGVLCRMGRPDQVGLWRHMTTCCCMGTHVVFSATSTSASGDWQCRCRPLAAVVGLRLAALLGLHPHVGLCRSLAAFLLCHFPERDTFGRLGAAAVDQGTALAGFARQGQRKNQNNKHMD